MNAKLKIFFFILFLFSVVIFNAPKSYAIVYLNLNAEEGTVGSYVPYPPFCQTECTGVGEKATYQSSGGAPQGSKYYQWQTVNIQHDRYTNISIPNGLVTNIIGKTFYLAYYLRFDRINGLDIWHEGSGTQSASKEMYLWGSNLRWGMMYGQWESHRVNQDHRYTVYVIDSNTYDLNSQIKVVGTYLQNQNGYSSNNPIQLEYERWYSTVFAVKIASDNTGSFTLYIDGIKVYEINNIQTVANSSPDIESLKLGGTLAQPAYDSPAHLSKWDAMLLTDNWQDIINGGYMNGGDTQAPSVPSVLSGQAISSSQINLTWTASTDDVGVTGYRIYRDSVEIATSSTTSYSNTGLSPSTTYSYTVSAYDATGNYSAQSSSASATTSGGGGGTGGGDASASGGSGCGYIKDNNGKGQKAKGEGLILIIMLLVTLSLFVLARRYKYVLSFAIKCNHWRKYDKNTDTNDRRTDKEIKKYSF